MTYIMLSDVWLHGLCERWLFSKEFTGGSLVHRLPCLRELLNPIIRCLYASL